MRSKFWISSIAVAAFALAIGSVVLYFGLKPDNATPSKATIVYTVDIVATPGSGAVYGTDKLGDPTSTNIRYVCADGFTTYALGQDPVNVGYGLAAQMTTLPDGEILLDFVGDNAAANQRLASVITTPAASADMPGEAFRLIPAMIQNGVRMDAAQFGSNATVQVCVRN